MKKIGIIGLGYVGLPLAIAFSKKFKVIGFDINKIRINNLNLALDETGEIDSKELQKRFDSKNLIISDKIEKIKDCKIKIITVPTPVDKFNTPNLAPLKKASKAVSHQLNKGDIVIYESTVYPGCTEEVCVPILEKNSRLKHNKDFYSGYSPERINPGDKIHTVEKIVKVTSGSNPEIAQKIDNLYKKIITAGTYLAPSIKVAEAAKIIENTQRDINIAFVNELSKLFDKLEINTFEVLKAASTKWNFLNFKPGLVGGHCIGVDPYYLAFKAKELGFHSEIILSGRRTNDSMPEFIATKLIREFIKKSINISKSKILILGITFKENCPDIRNSKVVDLFLKLNNLGVKVDIHDPLADFNEVKKEYDIEMINSYKLDDYNAIILAVPHAIFLKSDLNFSNDKIILFDLKSVLNNKNSLSL